MPRLYNLYYTDKNGNPKFLIGHGTWAPMTHHEAMTARSKFRNPSDITLVEIL